MMFQIKYNLYYLINKLLIARNYSLFNKMHTKKIRYIQRDCIQNGRNPRAVDHQGASL